MPAEVSAAPGGRVGRQARVGPFTAPAEAARAAALLHTTSAELGIARHVQGDGFRYVAPNGRTVRQAEVLARIKALVIPPGWTDVWIAANADAHLQATGRDARGRKQYRYHPHWRRVRDETKYGRAAFFAQSLPGIRKRVTFDLGRPGLSRERVLATIVRLLELTFIRVGNTEYARSNKSFGLTTLQDRHVQIAGASLVFKFRGKSGKSHEIRLTDQRLARLVKQCRDVPGQSLFQYIDETGTRHSIHSTDVNEYLRSVSGQEFTAKDFRTWAGTLLAAGALLQAYTAQTPFTKAAVLEAVRTVAAHLGNTPAVCRKCYIHPAILQSFDDEALLKRFVAEMGRTTRNTGLTREESALLRFLKSTEAKASAAASPS